ncbi:MAG: hypothetical protein LBG11_04690 [Bifidobacteriaceae bacterium]|jgi:hypothetical protein|nr:hypothetical protein [Bifidobacteriaceae bacterium]
MVRTCLVNQLTRQVSVKGGVVLVRGLGAAARRYVGADHSRADDPHRHIHLQIPSAKSRRSRPRLRRCVLAVDEVRALRAQLRGDKKTARGGLPEVDTVEHQ